MTRRLPALALLAALAVPPAARAWFGDRMVPAGRPVPGQPGAGAPPPGYFGPWGTPVAGPIAPPHPSKAAVVELLEDDAGRLARALISGKVLESQARAGAWGADCFSGACSLKVAGYQ